MQRNKAWQGNNLLLAETAFLFVFVTENKPRKAFQKSISKITSLHFIFATLREVFYFNSSPQKNRKRSLKIYSHYFPCHVLYCSLCPPLCQRSLLWISQKSYYSAISTIQEKQTKNPYPVTESDFWPVIHPSIL